MAGESELTLLRRLWDVVWNQTGWMDGGSYAVLDWADDVKITDAASAVEDYYAEHGFPLIRGERHE